MSKSGDNYAINIKIMRKWSFFVHFGKTGQGEGGKGNGRGVKFWKFFGGNVKNVGRRQSVDFVVKG